MCIGCTYRISTGQPYKEHIFCPELLNPEPDTSVYRLKWEPVKCGREGLKAKRLPFNKKRFEFMKEWLEKSGKGFSEEGELEMKRLYGEYGKKALSLEALFSIRHPAFMRVRYFRQIAFQKGFVLVGNNFSSFDMGTVKLSGSKRVLASVLEEAYSEQGMQEVESNNADEIAAALADEGLLKLNCVGFAAYPKKGEGVFGSGRKTFAKMVKMALKER